MCRNAGGGSSAKSGGAIKPNGKEGSIKGLKRDMQAETKVQAGKAQSVESIRKYGFESVDELRDYAVNRFISKGGINDTLRRAVNIEPLFGDAAIIRDAKKGINRRFADYLKNNLNVSVEQYGKDSFLVNMKRSSDGYKKRKRPKNAT